MLLSDGGGAQHRGCSSVARKITAKHRQASEGDNQGGTCAAAYWNDFQLLVKVTPI